MKTNNLHAGFSLVEVTVALGIAAFCLLALFALLPVGIHSNQASVTQSGATNIATGLVADLMATKAGDTKSPQFKIKMAGGGTLFFGADGAVSGAVDADADPKLSPFYRAMIVIKPDPTSGSKATSVRLLITWPALGDRKAQGEPSNFTGSFETVVALNRN